MKKIFCDECGKEIKPGNTNGMPNGIIFNGILVLCQDCLIKMGKGYVLDKKEGDAD